MLMTKNMRIQIDLAERSSIDPRRYASTNKEQLMKLKIACILIAVMLCVPLFENVMLSFFKQSQGYLFETGAIKSCPTRALGIYRNFKPLLYMGPYLGLIAGVFVGSTVSDIIEKLLKQKA
jgi:hypothetical protein